MYWDKVLSLLNGSIYTSSLPWSVIYSALLYVIIITLISYFILFFLLATSAALLY